MNDWLAAMVTEGARLSLVADSWEVGGRIADCEEGANEGIIGEMRVIPIEKSLLYLCDCSVNGSQHAKMKMSGRKKKG